METIWTMEKIPMEDRIKITKFMRKHGIRAQFAGPPMKQTYGMIDAILKHAK